MNIDLEKLQDSPHLLDLLVQMEDVLDSLDLYVFKNWLKGEIIDGPRIKRYWLDFTLRYDYQNMPDPKAGLRLLKHGIRVDFKTVDKEDHTEVEDNEDDENKEWHITISIPRRLITEINAGQLDYYDDEVDIDDVQDAQDSGIDDNSGIVDTDKPDSAEIDDEEGR